MKQVPNIIGRRVTTFRRISICATDTIDGGDSYIIYRQPFSRVREHCHAQGPKDAQLDGILPV